MRTPSGSDRCQSCRSVRLGGGYGWKSLSHTAVTPTVTNRSAISERPAYSAVYQGILQLGVSNKTCENPSICTLDLPQKQQAPRPQGRRTRAITSFFPHCLLSPPKMGLSGRKVKQRIPQDPRNLSWADGTLCVLFATSPFLAQHAVRRCISLWFIVSIQVGLRSYRQKCHPGHLRSGPHPTSQGKVYIFMYRQSLLHVLYRFTTNSTCLASEPSTRRTRTGSRGSKIETLKTYSRGSMQTRKVLRRVEPILSSLMASIQPVSIYPSRT